MANAPSEPDVPAGWRKAWRYSRALVAPVLIWLLLAFLVVNPMFEWLRGEEAYDAAAVQEWIEEARNADATLADLAEDYDKVARRYLDARARLDEARRGQAGVPEGEAQLFLLTEQLKERVVVKGQEVYQQLRTLGEPATKMYPGLLPLFPLVYRLEVQYASPPIDLVDGPDNVLTLYQPVIWDSGLEARSGQGRKDTFALGGGRSAREPVASVRVHYQLRAWNKRQRDEEQKARRVRQLGLLAVAATVLGVAWLMLLQADERESQRQRELARHRVDAAERELLEQRLATQAAEQKALELKSHLYASIGIMAGSYAHNIKNLLVRPNDLLRRCLERTGGEQERMLREVQQTLGTVTERLQQILQTVRRDPSRSELKPLDLNAALAATARTWGELAADRWQLDLVVEPAEGELLVEADDSHLHQTIENLLFNARDATFEMRNQLREDARRKPGLDATARRQALIAAAAWRGRVVVRTLREGGQVVLEVSDNGVGMTDEVKARCTETHFSTKRDNALYEGHSTGMGLGLSFVVAILEGHRARLEIESRPLGGTTFRIRFSEITRAVHVGNG
ncbi:MAG: HAMP domain-containing sensor histidine kinase [Gemmataceae bacterium]